MDDLGLSRSRVRRRRSRHRSNPDIRAKGSDSFEESSPSEIVQQMLDRIQRALQTAHAEEDDIPLECMNNILVRTDADRQAWRNASQAVIRQGWNPRQDESGWMNVLDRYLYAKGVSNASRSRVQEVYNRTRAVGAAMSEASVLPEFAAQTTIRYGIEDLVAGRLSVRDVLEVSTVAGVGSEPMAPMAMIQNYFGSEGQCPNCGEDLDSNGQCPKCQDEDDDEDDTKFGTV